ncbi:UDP-2,3-diacylglucosamine diphosphatase LpxI [soil metagenome]
MTAGVVPILPDPPPPPTPIGLIAAGGKLPVMIAEGLRKIGHPVHCIGLAGQVDPLLPAICNSFTPVGVLKLGAWVAALRRRGVAHAIMVGRVDKAQLLFNPWSMIKNMPDLRTARAWLKHLRHDHRSHVILRVIADELGAGGIELLDSTAPIPDHLATTGVMTARPPETGEQRDIEFGFPLLNELLRLDIGQSIAVKGADIVAVEGIEGTDRMIQRAGELCRGRGWILCKGARVGHDRRSDVPTVGVKTIENLAAAGARCLALASGDVIMIDRAGMLETADRLGITIVGVPAGPRIGL